MKVQDAENYSTGGVTYSEWSKDDFFQEQFKEWMEDGNVHKFEDGYSTQDAQWRNRLKNMSDLKRYFYKEFIKGQYNSYAGGGSTDDKHLIAKAIEYITGYAVDTDSIVKKGFTYNFTYKGRNVASSLDSKLIDDTIRMNKKSLESRYAQSSATKYMKGGEAGFDDAGTSLAMYHETKGNWLVPKGQVYLWLYDVENSAEKIESGEFDYVQYPLTSMSMAWQRGYIPPLKRIWTKKFQKMNKGSEHLLGVIKAFLINENGKEELYIDMMSVNPTKKKKGIMSYMIKDLRDTFNLSQDQVTFSQLTPEGKKFVAKKTYEDGGITIDEIDAKRKVLSDEVNKLIPVHKKKYGNMPIDSPKSEEEKESDKQIASLFSEINQLNILKRKLLKEQGEFANGGGVEEYINMDKMNPDKYQIVRNFNTLKSLAKMGFIQLDEKTGLRYKNYEDKMRGNRVTNVRHDYIKSAISPYFEHNNKKYYIGYEKGLNFLKLYVLEDITN